MSPSVPDALACAQLPYWALHLSPVVFAEGEALGDLTAESIGIACQTVPLQARGGDRAVTSAVLDG